MALNTTGYEDYETLHCGNYSSIFSYLLQIIYMFLQLIMIFKFHNVIVNRSKRLARVAFMHCIASSLCFWIGNIIMETFDVEIQDLINNNADKSMSNSTWLDLTWMDSTRLDSTWLDPTRLDLTSIKLIHFVIVPACPNNPYDYCQNNHQIFEMETSCLKAISCYCAEAIDFGKNLSYIVSYLYPFSIEFNILVGRHNFKLLIIVHDFFHSLLDCK